ncbi:MAG: chemotaxis protein CheB [Candidatus Neomarinimicrobiota bacterium]
MTLPQRFFQDPLLAAVFRVLSKDSTTSWTPLLVRLARELERSRKRQANVAFEQQEDPVLTAVNRVLQVEKVRLDWERIIFLGCSAGGDRALRELLRQVEYPHLPMVITMHHNPGFLFLSRLLMANGVEQLPEKVDNDMTIKSNRLYFVPGDKIVGYHNSDLAFKITPLEKKQHFRPLIDQVFSLAGRRFGSRMVGVIMTGMLDDGVSGLKDSFLNHGEALVQDPSTALFPDMPNAAIKAVPSAKVLSLAAIADRINVHSREYLVPKSFKAFFQTAQA